MKSTQIIFVGYRSQALVSAQKLGLNILLIHPKFDFLQKRVAVFLKRPLFELQANDAETIRRFQPQVVIPWVEKAIPLAGYIRKNFLEKSFLRQDKAEWQATLCHDKWLMKNHSVLKGIPVTPYRLIEAETKAPSIIQQLGLPLVLKPRTESGGYLFQKLEDLGSVEAALRPGLLAEQWITGEEFSVEMFVFQKKIVFKNVTAYHTRHEVNILPHSKISAEEEPLKALCEKLVSAFDIQNGIVHAEFFSTTSGYVMGEFTIRPPGGWIMPLLEKVYGINPWTAAIRCHLNENPFEKKIPRQRGYGAAVLFHPAKAGKEGVVRALHGLDIFSSLRSVWHWKFLCPPGTPVRLRERSSQAVGYALLFSEKESSLRDDINTLQTQVYFDIQETVS